MTEQEAEALAARLTRIWAPLSSGNQHPLWTLKDGLFDFNCRLEDEVSVWVEKDLRDNDTKIEFYPTSGNQYVPCPMTICRFLCSQGEGEGIYIDVDPVPTFIERYFSLFRRGCWLSGCPIEATAHEKAEWIQGFTREEIESWNLKI